MLLLLTAVLATGVPDNADFGLPPGVRGETNRETFKVNDDGSRGERTARSEDRFVAHQNWAKAVQYVEFSEEFGPQLQSAMVFARARVQSYTPERMAAAVWEPIHDMPSMNSVAAYASPIEHLRFFRKLESLGHEVVERRDGDWLIYSCTYPWPDGPSHSREIWLDVPTGQIRRATNQYAGKSKPEDVIHFLDWRPIPGTRWQHPTQIRVDISDNPHLGDLVTHTRLEINEVLRADAPTEFLKLGPDVRVTNHITGNIEDGTGKVLSTIADAEAQAAAVAGRSSPRGRALTEGSSPWLIGGGIACVAVGAIAFRINRGRSA